jgi:hypothetical protein
MQPSRPGAQRRDNDDGSTDAFTVTGGKVSRFETGQA